MDDEKLWPLLLEMVINDQIVHYMATNIADVLYGRVILISSVSLNLLYKNGCGFMVKSY